MHPGTHQAALDDSQAEQCLHSCMQALYQHLGLRTRWALRLVCRTARTAVDASVQRLERRLVYRQDQTDAVQMPAVNASRWPGAKQLVCRGQGWVRKKRGWLSSLEGLPPKLEVLLLQDSLTVGNAASLAAGRAPNLAALATVAGTLRHLELCYDHGGDSAALEAALCQLTALQRLHVCSRNGHTPTIGVTAPVLPRLRAQLRHLQLGCVPCYERYINSTCGADEAQKLTLALPQLTRLEVLDLSVLRANAAAVKVLLSALRSLTVLQHLNIRGLLNCGWDGGCWDGPMAVMPALTALQQLHIGKHWLSSLRAAVLLPLLATLTQLQVLDMSSSYLAGQGGALASTLRALPALSHLDLSACTAVASDAEQLLTALSSLTGLQHLSIIHIEVEKELGEYLPLPLDLTPLSNLRVLRIGTAALQVSAFSSLASLHKLELSCFGAGWMGMGLLGQTLHHLPDAAQLQELRITGYNGIVCNIGTVAQAVARFTRLRRLQLNDCPIDAAGLYRLLPELCRMQQLQELELTSMRLRTAGVQALASALSQLRHLTRLDVCSNWFNPSSVRLLVTEALSVLTELREMSIGDQQCYTSKLSRDEVLQLHALASAHLVQLYLDVGPPANRALGLLSPG